MAKVTWYITPRMSTFVVQECHSWLNHQNLKTALCLLWRPAEGKGCLQTEVDPLESGCHHLAVPLSRWAVTPWVESSIDSECRTVPLWQTSVELWAGQHPTHSRDYTISERSRSLPMCCVQTGNVQEGYLGVSLAVPFPSQGDTSALFKRQKPSPVLEMNTWLVSTCTGHLFPLGNPICVFFHGTVTLSVNLCLSLGRFRFAPSLNQ